MDYDEEQYNMESEINAHLRTAPGDVFINVLRGIKFKDKNSIEQFYTLVDAIFGKLLEKEIYFITEYTRKDIIDSISKVNKPGYKNAVAYILGYYTLDETGHINKDNIDMVFKQLPSINLLSFESPIFKVNKMDIIRYGRLWEKLK
jgi:hypothetical protein